MSQTISEFEQGSPETDGGRTVRRYYVTGSTDDAAARSYALAQIPTTDDGLPRQRVRVRRIFDGAHEAEAIFSSRAVGGEEPQQVGDDARESFRTTGRTERITHGLETIAAYTPGALDSIDFFGAINANANEVGGVEITVPVFEFQLTEVFEAAWITEAYKGILNAATGTTNDNTFRGLAAGECLFLGAEGTTRFDGKWEITFYFAASPNQTGLSVGSITGIDKKGFEYLWIYYEPEVDDTNSVITQEPRQVTIERVYASSDFSTLDPTPAP